MPHKAFLKKKSLIDRFKDSHKTTGFIQSARAEHTWNNPLTRRKRTKELNGWIKSFAGKRHIHKLARFNAMQAGKNESAEYNVDCLRYGSTLELPNGVCVRVKETIRCPRRAAFIFRVLAIVEGEDGFVIHGFYPVYGLECKPSEEFDLHSDDATALVSFIENNMFNSRGESMQHKLTIKLHETKFDPSQYDFFIASYTLNGNDRSKTTNGIVDAQGTLEDAQKHGATNLKLVGVKYNDKTEIPLKSLGISEHKDEAMSLKGFLEALEEKLVKQFDLDEDKVKNYLDSHTQEMQELLDDRELSLKEKVLFVRSEITGEKDEAKKSERLFNKRKMEHIALSEGSKVSPYLVEIAHKILTDEYGWKASTIEEVADWLGDHKQAFEHAYGQALRSSDDDKANVKAGIEAALDEEERGVMNAEIAMMGESKKQTNEMIGNKKWVIRIKRLGKNYYVCSSSFRVNKAFRYPSLGGPFVCSDWDITERDIAKYDNYNDAKKAWDGMAQVIRGGLPFYKEGEDYEIVQVNFSMMGESKEPADEKLGYEKGHKNSKGEDAPWVIRSHEDNRILASFAKKTDAEEHLQRMKQYSKQESMSADELDKYIKDVKSLLKSKYGMDFNDKDTCRLNVGWLEKLDAMFYQGKSVEDGAKEVAAFCGYNKDESKKSERLFNKSEMEKIALSEASSLDNYRKDVISELAVSFHYGEDGATKLADKNSTIISDAYVEGELLPYETARLIAQQDGNGYANESKKSESKQSEVHLELIDTIIVPKWLWEAYITGNYSELTDDELETIQDFKLKYDKNRLIDTEKEPTFYSINDIDNVGGICYEIDVFVEK